MDSARRSLLFGTGRDTVTSVVISSTGNTALARYKSMDCSLDEESAPDANTIGILLQRSCNEVGYATAAYD